MAFDSHPIGVMTWTPSNLTREQLEERRLEGGRLLRAGHTLPSGNCATPECQSGQCECLGQDRPAVTVFAVCGAEKPLAVRRN